MMTPWNAPTIEISALEAAIATVIRAGILPTVDLDVPAPEPGGWRRIPLGDQSEARIIVNYAAPSQSTRDRRAVLTYRFSGHATLDLVGHRFTGSASLDLATQAFLDCDFRIESVGAFGG